MRDRSDDTEHGVEEVTPFAQPDQPGPYADVGDAVAGVLRAAEEAAERIRGEARTQAREIVEGAHGEASVRIQELTREAERSREDADAYARDVREAVDGYGTQQRRDAEEESRQILADAEEQARATREAAQEMARQIDLEGRGDRHRLNEELRTLEDRRKRVLRELRDVAFQLDDLLPPRDAPPQTGILDALESERRS